MALTNPISISYGGITVGGDSAYQIDGPFVVERSFDAIRLVFAIVVTADDFDDFGTRCAALESASNGRLTGSISVTVGGSSSTYNVGSSILKARVGIAKSGNPDTDKAHSRGYTVSITGEAPADTANEGGLRELEVLVNFLPSRQKTVTMRGVYTATSAGDAKARYDSAFDGVASSYLTIAGSSDTFELVDESYTLDRETDTSAHLCSFSRQYVQLLANQSQASLDDSQIKDHRITFTDLGQYPGDGTETTERMRRVVASFDCAVDASVTKNLRGVYSNKIKPYLRETFRSNFEPVEFAVEDERISFDSTSNRLSVSTQYLYQNAGAEPLVEVSQSVAYRETRTIDYTPVHDGGELSAYADVGFATLERIFNRTAIVIGEEAPKLRLREPRTAGIIGPWRDPVAGQSGPDSRPTSRISQSGWNTVSNTSQATPQWVGNPGEDNRIRLTVLTETVVERYHTKPGTVTAGPITG